MKQRAISDFFGRAATEAAVGTKEEDHKVAKEAAATVDSAVSEYERKRNEKIRENREALERVGLQESERRALIGSHPRARRASPSKTTRRSVPSPPPTFSGYRLRKRVRGSSAEEDEDEGDGDDKGADETEKVDGALHEEETGVTKYSCRAAESAGAPISDAAALEKVVRSAVDGQRPSMEGASNGVRRSLFGFRDTGAEVGDDELARTYCMNLTEDASLLAAGGHQGRVAVYPLCTGSAAEAASFKAHSGWVSGVRFMAASSGSRRLLLTSGNDRAVVLWRLPARSANGGAADDSNTGEVGERVEASVVAKLESGVFSLHERDGMALVGCKDGSAVVLDVGNGLATVHSFPGLHDGVVKAARFKHGSNSVFASTGNDRSVHIVDTRVPLHGQPQCTMADVHDLAANSVEWSPASEHVLATASFDCTIAILDARMPDGVVHRLRGHCRRQPGKSIHHAVFCGDGEAIATSGDGSTQLSLYRVADGSTISRGEIGYEATALEPFGTSTPLLCAAHARRVSFLSPIRSNQIEA